MLLLLPLVFLGGTVLLSPSLVMAAEPPAEEGFQLKSCTGGFEFDYFSFFIEIEKFTEDCSDDDFDRISETVQDVIDDVQQSIPEYKDEFIDAQICPNPTFLEERRALYLRSLQTAAPLKRRRRRRAGKYSFVGDGRCRRCKRVTTARRRHLEFVKEENEIYRPIQLNTFKRRTLKEEAVIYESLHDHICAMEDSVVVAVAVAERAVVAAEKRLQELETISQERETTDLLEEEEITKYIEEGKKKLQEAKEARMDVKGRAFYVMNACDKVDSVNVETEEGEQGLMSIGDEMKDDIEKDAKHARDDYYKVKDQKIKLKTSVVKTRFGLIRDAMELEWEELQAKVDRAVEKLEEEITKIDLNMKKAKESGDKKKESKLQETKEKLEDETKKLEEDFKELKKSEQQKYDNDYDFAIGIIEVEAANTFESYLEAFAELIEPALENRLFSKYSSCFEGQPKVTTEVVELEKENRRECPDEE